MKLFVSIHNSLFRPYPLLGMVYKSAIGLNLPILPEKSSERLFYEGSEWVASRGLTQIEIQSR